MGGFSSNYYVNVSLILADVKGIEGERGKKMNVGGWEIGNKDKRKRVGKRGVRKCEGRKLLNKKQVEVKEGG